MWKLERLMSVGAISILTTVVIYVTKYPSVVSQHYSKWQYNDNGYSKLSPSASHVTPVETTDGIQKRMDDLERKWRKTDMKIEELSCRLNDVGTRGGFCLTKDKLEVGGNWAWDHSLAHTMEDLLENQVVGDFGAGLGWYGRFFLRKTKAYFHTAPDVEKKYFFDNQAARQLMEEKQKVANWTGYDGATFVSEVTGGLVKYLDLSEPFLLSQKFDWILSLEVGEHIPIEFEQNFLDNLDKHSCKGVILSWAIPGQGGHHHVNNRPSQYIIDQMAKRGFQFDENWTDRFRSAAELSWFKNSTMTFSRKTFLQHPHCPQSKNARSNPNTAFVPA